MKSKRANRNQNWFHSRIILPLQRLNKLIFIIVLSLSLIQTVQAEESLSWFESNGLTISVDSNPRIDVDIVITNIDLDKEEKEIDSIPWGSYSNIESSYSYNEIREGIKNEGSNYTYILSYDRKSTPLEIYLTHNGPSLVGTFNKSYYGVPLDSFYVYVRSSDYPLYKEIVTFDESNKQIFVDFENLEELNARKHKNDVESSIHYAKEFDIEVAEEEILFSEIEKAFNNENYAEAEKLSNEAKKLLESKIEAETPRIQAITAKYDAELVILQEREMGFSSEEAEALLLEAEKTLNDGDYEKVETLVEDAKTRALDVDGDGANNDEDFAPTINNNSIIYIAKMLFILLIILFIIKLHYSQQKKREKRKAEALKDEIIARIKEVESEGD